MPSVAATGNFRIVTIVRSAGRRRLWTLTLDQLGFASASVLAGAIVLLVLGTEAVPPYWLVILAGIALSVSAYRIRERRLSDYQIAQILDRRLQLQDSLSTAWYLLTRPDLESTPAAVFQVHRAEGIAAGVDPASAFPFLGRRSWQVAGALAVAVVSLFISRYLVTRSLSLQHTMMPFQFADLVERLENSVRPNRPGLKSVGGRGTPEPVPGRQTEKITQSPNAVAPRGQENGTPQEVSRNPAGNQETRSGEAKSDGKNGSSQSGDSRRDQTAQTSAEQDGAKQTASKEDQQNAATQKTSGLVDRMKDALSSLMAKLRPNANSQRSSQQNQRSSEAQRQGEEASPGEEKNQNSQGARNQQSNQQASAEGAAEGATAEKTRNSGRSSTESADRKTDSAQSGVGHQNGDKDIKDAEQLKAMGKLAEIIGKRSSNLTGDVTIETSSGNQHLKTQYSGRVGQHMDLGGEINRDQVPISYRKYVREYMDLIRKQEEKAHH